ncbi:PH domain-containing protein [Corynebacterium godavarianum]|uniref:PH domain-containing protein n=2 Tax=Corynebacterium godavarianum TaxID=2054421 RepID=A0ABY3E1E4_9CORY|nr:PH domain-containing protein [Corynebacterium godavarianum]TSJ73422.1 PH domain-containing protein [Corynebacterium godavarianum]
MPIYNWLDEEDVGLTEAGWALGAVVLALLVIFGVSQLWWARTGFRVDDEEIEMRRGVLTTQIRTARYDRVQAVDIVEPFAPRLFGLAGVRIEAAGGAQANIEVAFLPRGEAESLRKEILARMQGHAPLGDAAFSAPVTPPDLVAPIPIKRSLAAAALQFSTLFTVAWAMIPVFSGLTIAAVLPVLVSFMPQIWRTIDQSWRFNSSLDGDVINLTYGLANRRRQAVPVDRIHAVQLKRPMLWRLFGWWQVSVTVAGYGSEMNKATGTSKLLPVGTYEQAARVIDAIGPLTAAELTAPRISTATVSARSPRQARWVSPVDWRQQSVAVDSGRGVARVTFGRLTRRFQAVKIPHIQELTYRQGPWQRRLGLAHVRFDLVPGAVKVTARDLDDAQARTLVDAFRARTLPALEPTDVMGEDAVDGVAEGRR